MADDPKAPIDPLSLEVPAPFVNKFQVLVAGTNVRVTFAEGFANQPNNYRSAVMLSAGDARALALAIIESLPPARNALLDAYINQHPYAGTIFDAASGLTGAVQPPKGSRNG